ncbi:MAG: helix-turn-helix domain-containing protein, partial [Pseudomonadota bacterium]
RCPSVSPSHQAPSRFGLIFRYSRRLQDIVAETTDVVERMCIETAVELTRNNRVAAAEMLGLSRQSLYVKLRKYGLLSRDTD